MTLYFIFVFEIASSLSLLAMTARDAETDYHTLVKWFPPAPKML